MKQKYFWALGALGAVAVAAYFGTRWYLDQETAQERTRRLSARPERNLSNSDHRGNYDLDGVSFDDETSEVIVSGDNTHDEESKRNVLLH